MGKMDASIQGWYIDPAEVSICKRPEDGGDWLLGTGSYGKVGRCACCAWHCVHKLCLAVTSDDWIAMRCIWPA